jgi:hypothetical protein
LCAIKGDQNSKVFCANKYVSEGKQDNINNISNNCIRLWMRKVVCDIDGETQAEGVRQCGAEKDIWASEGQRSRGLKGKVLLEALNTK